MSDCFSCRLCFKALADLWKSIGMAANNSHIARLRVLIIDRRILFDCELEILILSGCSRSRVFAYI